MLGMVGRWWRWFGVVLVLVSYWMKNIGKKWEVMRGDKICEEGKTNRERELNRLELLAS